MSKNKNIKNFSLFAEKFSFICFLKLLINLKRIKKVYVLDSIEFYEHNPKAFSLWEKLSKLFFKNIKFIKLPEYKNINIVKKKSELCWKSNQITLEFLDSSFFQKKLKKISESFILFSIDPKIEIALKKRFLPDVFFKILFYLQLDKLSKKENILFLEEKSDFFCLKKYLNKFHSTDLSISESRLLRATEVFKSFFLIIFSPLLLREIFRRGIRLKKIKQKKFDTAIHLVTGFPSSEFDEESKMKKVNYGDDIFFNSKNLEIKKNIFVQGRWTFSNKVEKINKAKISSFESSFVEDKKLKIPIKIFFYHFVYIGIIKLLFAFITSRFNKSRLPYWMIFSLQKIQHSFIYHLIFCKYVQAKIFISRDDYDIDHITRTIVQNSNNLKNYGVAHSTFQEPYALPFHAHTYFNKYYTAGSGYKNLWHPYWKTNDEMIPVGPHRDHIIVDSEKDYSLQTRFKKKYPFSKIILLLWSQLDNLNSPEWLIKRKYEGIEKLFEIDPSIHLIIRPRNYEASKSITKMFPSLKNFIERKKMTIEMNDFITQEIIPFVDILVTEDGSSAIIEASHRNDLLLLSLNVRYPSFKIHEDLCAENMNELCELISKFYKGKDCSKEQKAKRKINKIYAMSPPGQTWQRISSDISKDLINYN